MTCTWHTGLGSALALRWTFTDGWMYIPAGAASCALGMYVQGMSQSSEIVYRVRSRELVAGSIIIVA